jgi:hypothetical protein
MSAQQYHYQNLSLKNIKGEKWKDIPGFEDEYQLSNYGRLKSQDRWVDYGKHDSFRPGRIIKLRLSGSAKNNNRHDLQMKLHKDGIRYHYSVARFVYCQFVKSFDREDHTLIVTRKDGDTLNCYYKNLVLRSISEIAKEGFAANKRKSIFQLQSKPVTQYDPDGKKIALFKDAKQAAATTGITPNYINDAARTKDRMAGGYYWRYGKPKARIKVLGLKKPIALPPNNEQVLHGHHYLNRSLKNIRNEKWKDVLGFEGLYQISDHGRIKSLRRLKQIITPNGNNTQCWTREFIMKQTFRNSFNHYINKILYYLSVSLKKEGVYTTYIVPRLVYESFGKNKSELASKFIAHRDNDNLNNHISNLYPATQSEINIETYANNRKKSHFAGLTEKLRKKYSTLAIQAKKKPVIQYNIQGKRIAKFDSAVAAAKATGIGDTSISNAINGKYKTAGGFIWKR